MCTLFSQDSLTQRYRIHSLLFVSAIKLYSKGIGEKDGDLYIGKRIELNQWSIKMKFESNQWHEWLISIDRLHFNFWFRNANWNWRLCILYSIVLVSTTSASILSVFSMCSFRFWSSDCCRNAQHAKYNAILWTHNNIMQAIFFSRTSFRFSLFATCFFYCCCCSWV